MNLHLLANKFVRDSHGNVFKLGRVDNPVNTPSLSAEILDYAYEKYEYRPRECGLGVYQFDYETAFGLKEITQAKFNVALGLVMFLAAKELAEAPYGAMTVPFKMNHERRVILRILAYLHKPDAELLETKLLGLGKMEEAI